jgi:diguanylate cyclase (GGDEF)-like protein
VTLSNNSLERWIEAPSLAPDSLPRVEADFLLAVLERDAADPHAVAFATRRFALACTSTESAVAHLLTLRHVLGSPVPTAIVDRQILDIISRELAEARRTAHTDALTGLGNRRALEEALGAAVARAARSNTGLGVLYFDLVGLKAVNDRHGHHVGDDAIRAFASALAQSTRASDLTYRVGGDEFVALLPSTEPDEVSALVDRIIRSGAPPFSWGSSNTRSDGLDAGRLIRIADLRMLSTRYQLSLKEAAEPGGAATTVEPEVDLRSQSTSRATSS